MFRHSPGETEENHEKSDSSLCDGNSNLEPPEYKLGVPKDSATTVEVIYIRIKV
jgi:hypothetical protein